MLELNMDALLRVSWAVVVFQLAFDDCLAGCFSGRCGVDVKFLLYWLKGGTTNDPLATGILDTIRLSTSVSVFDSLFALSSLAPEAISMP